MEDESLTPLRWIRIGSIHTGEHDFDAWTKSRLQSRNGHGQYSSSGPATTPGFPDTPMSVCTPDSRRCDIVPEEEHLHIEGRTLSHVQIPRPSLPSVAFTSLEPQKVVSEKDAIFSLTGGHLSNLVESEDGHRYLELDDFSIYRPPTSKRAMDLCTLDKLQANFGVDCLCFSGTLSNGKDKRRVRDVPFERLAIAGYGDTDCDTMRDKICIEPQETSKSLWYRLGRPSKEYMGFYRPFLWLVTFTKLFVDFLIANQRQSVTLSFFRANFTTWAVKEYSLRSFFQSWYSQCGYQKDFGTSAAAFVLFLYKECYSIDDPEVGLLRHPIWREIDPVNLTAIKRQLSNEDQRTVVTPFVYRCFEDMYFASHLSLKEPQPEILEHITSLKKQRCLTPWNAKPTERPHIDLAEQDEPEDGPHLIDVQHGDVVCVEPNECNWKNSKSTIWYAYVQSVYQNRSGNRKLDVIWLYESSDTTIGDAFYPFRNELFFSDNCSCRGDAIPLETVVAKLDVSWFCSDPESTPGYFVRQKFHTSEEDDCYGFTTLTSEDFSCAYNHMTSFEEFLTKYKAGQTVLVHPRGSDVLLQPMRIISINLDTHKILLRKFLRSSDRDTGAPPNELYESDAEPVALPHYRISRHCRVARFALRDQVQSPFNCDGAGDHFYMLREDFVSSHSTLATPPGSDDGKQTESTQAAQGNVSPLAGLDLFCGGGNFGRGLEEAGVVEMKYAVDWDAAALHSYRANVKNTSDVHYFLGSVNDYLRRALHGSKSMLVAAIGAIGLIVAGSPCPGFSNMQPNKQSHQSLQFASMVASVVAFVDYYSPEYFVLENVVQMTGKIIVDGREQNVFSQIIGGLVALGYQVQQFLGDAWSLGSSQHRSRVFIVASAPEKTPLVPPPRTHGHHIGKKITKTLGKTTNGLSFGIRRFEPTPFEGISARETTADLPDIGDSLPQICPQFPDHRTFADQSHTTRQRIARVPTHPYGMGLQQAVTNGDVTSGEAYEWVKNSKGQRAKEGSRSYTRVRPDGLFPTIMTALHIQCAFNGKTLHWEQHRSLSVMETRRALGFLDHEVIVGVPSQQLKIVGNSVDRKVAFALGLAIKYSWEATTKRKREALQSETTVEDDKTALREKSEALQGNTSTDNEATLRQTLKRPLSAMAHGDDQNYHAERSKKFKDILRNLIPSEHKDPAAEQLEALENGHRWSGDSPVDALKVRRRMAELEWYLHSSD